MQMAYAICRRGGTTVSAGLPRPDAEFSFPHAALVGDERRILGSYMGSCIPQRDIPRFLALYKSGRLPVDRLRSGFIGLDELNEAFDRLADGAAVRQILRCH
jgi:alcohol dehydrogenase